MDKKTAQGKGLLSLIKEHKGEIVIIAGIITFIFLELFSLSLTVVNSSPHTVYINKVGSNRIEANSKDKIKFYPYELWHQENITFFIMDSSGVKKEFKFNIEFARKLKEQGISPIIYIYDSGLNTEKSHKDAV